MADEDAAESLTSAEMLRRERIRAAREKLRLERDAGRRWLAQQDEARAHGEPSEDTKPSGQATAPHQVFGAQPVRIAPQEPLILAHPSQMREATSPWASFWSAAFTFSLGVVASAFPTAWPLITTPGAIAEATNQDVLQTMMFVGGAVGAAVTLVPASLGIINQLGVIHRMLSGKQCEIDVASGRLVEVPPDRAVPSEKTFGARAWDGVKSLWPKLGRDEVG